MTDLNKQEPLNEELAEYLNSDDRMSMIRHPLVYAVPYFEQMNSHYNKQLIGKREAVAKCIETSNWSTLIALHERPYRIEAFIEYMDSFSDKDYWELLSWIWTDSENIYQNLPMWIELLLGRDKQDSYFMSDEDLDKFNSLPDEFIIYRGGIDDTGLSWTLSEKTAQWFAKRFNKKMKIFKRKVKKSEVFAYLNSRQENEIIYIPKES